jgi:hypothetical protein
MEQKKSFSDFITSICKRPSMFTLGGSYNEIVAYISGYIDSKNTALSKSNWLIFNKYVCLKFSFPTNYDSFYVIKESANDDKVAIKLLEETILEFIDLRVNLSESKLYKYAIDTCTYNEALPEKICRQFNEALLNGNKEAIISVIIENENAAILWNGKYPTDIAKMLLEISSNQPIRRIYESENGNQIKLLTTEYPFPIEMNCIDGIWKINASDIIGIRMNNNKTE